MPCKKIKLNEGVISEILVADSDSESGSEASDFDVFLRRKKKRTNNCKPQQKSKHGRQRAADYQPGDHLKEGTQIFILLLVQQKA